MYFMGWSSLDLGDAWMLLTYHTIGQASKEAVLFVFGHCHRSAPATHEKGGQRERWRWVRIPLLDVTTEAC
jgi:hypothetical protein